MLESERLKHEPFGPPSFVNALARLLNEHDEYPGEWTGYHYGVAVPDAAMLTRVSPNEAGRQVLTGIMLLGDAITADQLRKVSVSAIENSANLSTDKAGEKVRAETANLPPLVRTPEMSAEEFSGLVAAHYKAWERHVPHPAAALAAQWGVKPPTVHTWIREARLRGLLPEVKRGKRSR